MRTLRLTVAMFAVTALGFGLAGCNEEEDGARIIVDIVSLNDNAPLFSDVYNLNNTPEKPEDDFIPIDVVEVTFAARPHDPVAALSPTGPFGSVRFTRYRVEFLDPDHATGADLDGNGTVDLANFEGPMNAVVPVRSTASAYVLIVSGGVKSVSPIWDLIYGGEYSTEARITFYGQEETSGESVEIVRGLVVRLADFGDNK